MTRGEGWGLTAGMGSDLYPAAKDLLAKLVSFDTTSRDSNLALVEWVEGEMQQTRAA